MKSFNTVFFCLLFVGILVSSCNNTPPKTVADLPVLGNVRIVDGDTVQHTIPNFSFWDQDSLLVDESMVDGKVYVSDFFFTFCPTICPRMSAQMLRVHNEFLEEDDVKLFSHTIAPDYDSVAVLKKYADKLGADSKRWHFLTGDQDSIYAIAQKYMVFAGADSAAPGGYVHSGAFVLLDKQRRVRGYYDGTQPEQVDEMMTDMRLLLSE